MITNYAKFVGIHRGRPAEIEFQSTIGRAWAVTMTVGGKTIRAQCSKSAVKPCMTHAGYLLNKHFPHPLDGAPSRRPRKISEHEATVTESTFVEVKNGTRLRVVK